MGTRAVVIIPARLDSRRFPRKVLLPLGEQPLLLCTARRAAQASRVSAVWIATADDEVAAVADRAGFGVLATSGTPRNGTERVAEAARSIDAELVVNVQADEIFVEPAAVDAVIEALGHSGIATAACPLDARERADPSVVKVVCRADGRALYFSRAPIPHGSGASRKHIGIYGFHGEVLQRCAEGQPTPLELSEGLEQLRWLERGEEIHVVDAGPTGPSINTPRDLDRIKDRLADI